MGNMGSNTVYADCNGGGLGGGSCNNYNTVSQDQDIGGGDLGGVKGNSCSYRAMKDISNIAGSSQSHRYGNGNSINVNLSRDILFINTSP